MLRERSGKVNQMKWRPQIIIAMSIMGILGVLIVLLAPNMIDKIISGIITGLGMLGMKLLEGE